MASPCDCYQAPAGAWDQYAVSVSGVTAGSCSLASCDDNDATYTVAKKSGDCLCFDDQGCCTYTLTPSGGSCKVSSVTVNLDKNTSTNSTDLVAEFSYPAPATGKITYKKTGILSALEPGTPDNSFTLSKTGDTTAGQCTWPSTIKVTPVAPSLSSLKGASCLPPMAAVAIPAPPMFRKLCCCFPIAPGVKDCGECCSCRAMPWKVLAYWPPGYPKPGPGCPPASFGQAKEECDYDAGCWACGIKEIDPGIM